MGGDFEEDEDYTIGYGTAIDDLTTEDVTLFETDFTTAGTTDTDAGTFVSGAAAASADEDLKDNWSWVAYDVVIGESARFAVSRAVAAPDSDVDVSFAGDDFSFSWVYYEGGDRNEFETNSPFDAVTVEFPEEEEEEEESEGGESEESEEESDSASMIVSSIVSLLSLFVIFA